MSDTDNDTSLIDQTKEENSSSTSTSNILSYITYIIKTILVVFLYFSGSGLILYLCKLAQSNILPTEQKCYPYTVNKPNIEKITTNIFPKFTDKDMSMKLSFPYDDYNSKNSLLSMFSNYKNNSSSNFLANYFISIMENLTAMNYSSLNTIMNMLNGFPEFLIVLLGPLIFIFVLLILGIINLIYSIYLWFANMSWFFKTNTNNSGNGPPKWEDVTWISPVNWTCGVLLIILFIILFFVGFGLIGFIISFITLYCIISCFMYKSIFNDKASSSFTIIKEVLKNYKVTIVILISYFLISSAFSKLGTMAGIFSILTVILIYFGIISINIFKPVTENNLTPVVSYDQAKKNCIPTKSANNLSNFFGLFGGDQKGGNITKILKKIAKNQDKVN